MRIHSEAILYPNISFYQNEANDVVPIPPGRYRVGTYNGFIFGIFINNDIRPIFNAAGIWTIVSIVGNNNLPPEQIFDDPAFHNSRGHTRIAIIMPQN